MVRLDSEQTKVVTSGSTDLVVTASAGSGKTRVLTERYLRLVTEQGIPPDRILTITFTNKAAYEMKSRIVATLQQRGLHAEAQLAETGPIQTIHSFCERLLRENSVVAGIDPQFDVLGTSETAQILENALQKTLALGPADDPDIDVTLRKHAGSSSFAGRGKPMMKIRELILRFVHLIRESGESFQSASKMFESPEALETRFEVWALESIPGIDSTKLIGPEEFLTRLSRAIPYRTKNPLRKVDEAMLEVHRQSLKSTVGLAKLALRVWVEVQSQMTQIQSLDFTAMEQMAVGLLENSQDVRERLAAQFDVVFVDEAQDVNPMQYRLIDRLSVGQRMLVGDPQQSIYGFRNADITLFRERSEVSDAIRLPHNYRASPSLQRFVDSVFRQAWGESYHAMRPPGEGFDLDSDGEDAFDGVEIWQTDDAWHKQVATQIKDLIQGGQSPAEIAVLVIRTKEGLELERCMNHLQIPVRLQSGNESFYLRLEVRDLSNLLRASADPHDDFALLAVLRSPAVQLSLDAIFELGNKGRLFESLSTYNSPVDADNERIAQFLSWYKPLTEYADRMAAWEVLNVIFSKSRLLENLARMPSRDRLIANVRKLHRLAMAQPEMGPLAFAQVVRQIQELKHKESDAASSDDNVDAVTILTVHKAKGLEFPTVILATTRDSVKFVERLGVEGDSRNLMIAAKGDTADGPMMQFLKAKRHQNEEAEALRVLYVALTRAKQRLIIAGNPQRNGRYCALIGGLIQWSKDQRPPLIKFIDLQSNSKSADGLVPEVDFNE
jgi:ATP-dependent exoDNAse (exonuclease V) beta subunit